MQRFVHRAGVGVTAWRQGAAASAAGTCAPRDAHRRIVSRGRVVRGAVGFTSVGVTSVSSDLATSYNIITRVSADAGASYSIGAAVVSEATANYNILALYTVTSDTSGAYSIRAAIAADMVATYSVAGGSIPAAAEIADQVRINLATELAYIMDLARIHGLVLGTPLAITPSSRVAGSVVQTISGDGTATTTVSRTP